MVLNFMCLGLILGSLQQYRFPWHALGRSDTVSPGKGPDINIWNNFRKFPGDSEAIVPLRNTTVLGGIPPKANLDKGVHEQMVY